MRSNLLLWIVQGLLAALFLFAGGFKLIAPATAFAGPFPLPVAFIRFIGVCEVLGAVGLVLPWLLRIAPRLTPVAAAGLVIIMIGATTLTAAYVSAAQAIFPLVVGVGAACIAYGRSRVVRVDVAWSPA